MFIDAGALVNTCPVLSLTAEAGGDPLHTMARVATSAATTMTIFLAAAFEMATGGGS